MIILILNQLNLYFLLLIMCTCTTIDNSLIKKNTHQTAEVKNHFGLKLNLIDSILWISVVVIHYQGCQNHLAIGEKSQPGLFVWLFRKSCKNHPPPPPAPTIRHILQNYVTTLDYITLLLLWVLLIVGQWPSGSWSVVCGWLHALQFVEDLIPEYTQSCR